MPFLVKLPLSVNKYTLEIHAHQMELRVKRANWFSHTLFVYIGLNLSKVQFVQAI